jgi:uncharacterized repeat protein (TIGR04076 family)
MPTLTARSRFAPYAASPPVNGKTSPIRSVNAQFLDCSAVRVTPADPTDVASAAATPTITSAASAVIPLFLTIPPLLLSTEVTTLTGLSLSRKYLVMLPRVTEMRLYDIRVTVERIEGRSVCGLAVGDYFEVTESNRVRIPEGRHFCLYAMQAVMPLIPAKQRQLAPEDWLEQDNLVACPDPDERVIMRIERTGERTLITEDLT